MLGRKPAYDRQEILAAADEARARGKHKKAIAAYRKILEVDPNDFDVHGKIAPLLAAAGDGSGALKSYRLCAEGHEQKGFADRAIAVYSQAAQLRPTELDIWQRMARLHWERGRRADAFRVLWQGSRYFRRKPQRGQAIALLEEAAGIDPTHIPLALDLARLLAKEKRKTQALTLLDLRAGTLHGVGLRRIRAAQFRIAPTMGSVWRWMRAWFE